MVTYLGTFSKTGEIEAGKRLTNRVAYIAKSQQGRITSPTISKESAKFLFLNEEGLGTLVSTGKPNGIYIAPSTIGKIDKDDKNGFSTTGLGTIQQIVDAKDKEVRRWPRNWYGDNIKS